MEDQGIMALPQAGMQAPTAQPVAQVGEAEQAAFEQARMQVNPKEFGDALLEQAKNADPEAVDEFVQLLNSINLPMEVIDLLGQVVDVILADPQNYPQIRASLLAEGIPEDLLPPEFDPNYFAALNMALDQMSARSMAPEPQAFAKGGIVQLNPIAAALAGKGRHGDRLLAHITHGEARLLRRRGGSGTINPETGLPEFFIDKIVKGAKNLVKGVGKALKDVGRGIKKFASSSIGRMVTTVALGFFLGPSAAAAMGVSSAAGIAAMSGFVGGFGSSMLAGQSVKDALRTGAFGALTAGAITGLTTPGAFAASANAPTSFSQALSQQTDKFTGGIKSLIGGNVSQVQAPPATPTQAAIPTPTETVASNVIPSDVARGEFVDKALAQRGLQYNPSGGPLIEAMPPDVASGQAVDRALAQRGLQYNPSGGPLVQGAPTNVAGAQLAQQPPYNYIDSSTVVPEQSLFDQAAAGAKKVGQGIMDFYNPESSPQDLNAAAQKLSGGAYKNYQEAFTDLTSKNTPAAAKQLAAIQKAAEPMFGTTSRVVGTGLGALALTGGFKQEPVTPPNIVPKETGYDLLRSRPDIFGVTVGGGQTVYPTRPGMMYAATGGIAAVAPRKYNLGGYANGGQPRHFPRRTGQISGPGTETSDSIPAMLSDGEFVMTARAVRGAGGGSRREGAKRMYQMMRAFERKA